MLRSAALGIATGLITLHGTDLERPSVMLSKRSCSRHGLPSDMAGASITARGRRIDMARCGFCRGELALCNRLWQAALGLSS